MNNKLIQNYLDNQLSQSEKAQFESEIAANPQLSTEIESLKSFKSAIQQACHGEPTPNLQPALANIARPQSTNWFTRVAPIAIAGFAIFAIGIAVNRVITDNANPTIAIAKSLPPEAKLQSKSEMVMHWDGTDPEQGAEKIRAVFQRPIPTITLKELAGAKFTAAECGGCWISFHYQYQNQNYAIYGRRETGNLNSGSPTSSGNQTFYEFRDAIGWYDKEDMTYVCTGGTSTGRKVVAQIASKRTSELR